MALIKLGSQGPDVKRLQLLLRSKLVPPQVIPVDGIFGKRTEDAVKAFQTQSGLKADGIVGPQTWTALGQKIGNAVVPVGPAASVGAMIASASSTLIASAASGAAAKAATGPKQKKDIMEIAKAELGVSENHLPGQDTARIVEYHKTTTLGSEKDETPWCSSFVNWVVIQAGYKGTNSALASSWLTWGSQATHGSVGAVTVIKQKKLKKDDKASGTHTGNHVGFFVDQSNSHIRLLGGNQSDSVKYSSFPLSAWEVKTYRVP